MRPEHVLDEFQRAGQSLRAAEVLHDDELFADAVSRSYYAVMHAAKAALLAHDAIAESHGAVRRLFGSVLVRPGLVEERWADILAEEQKERVAADYDAAAAWAAEDSFRLLGEARAFVQRIREYLASVGIPITG